jgi:HEAT repeat protein
MSLVVFVMPLPLPAPNRLTRYAVVLGMAAIVGLWSSKSWAAEKSKVDAAIQRGQSLLLGQPKSGPEGSLAWYALIKSGIGKQHPEVLKQVEEVVAKCRPEGYRPKLQHNYEAGVDAMLLEAVDPAAYQPQLQSIASFLISRQLACGAWYYPNDAERLNQGDTSITQYAVLGLWAASRAGVEVPIEVWEKTAQWLMQSQCADGGFAYHPSEGPISTMTMTAAGTGTLLIIRHVLLGGGGFDDGARPAAVSRRFGFLERLPDEKRGDKPKVKTASTLTRGAFDKTLKESVPWMGTHFADKSKVYVDRPTYYYYGVERVGALLDVEKIGTHNWYEEGADDLLMKQLSNGAWPGFDSPVANTSLALLFLSKATATVITKPKRTALVGGGLLVGGRGLPDSLDAVKVKDGQLAERNVQGRVDGLLADLETSSDAKVEAVQAAVVEVVQLDRPEDLIGQVDRLKRLASDARVEVRRTAMWALGRTGNISVAPLLIQGLTDADESVIREASLGLSILSRKPDGSGLPVEPTEGLKENASADERKSHLDQWRKDSVNLWQKWYLRVRPYSERDDRTLLKRKS